MITPEIQARIDALKAEMKPLMDHYGIESLTVEQRYQQIEQRKAAAAQRPKLRPKPRWKLY